MPLIIPASASVIIPDVLFVVRAAFQPDSLFSEVSPFLKETGSKTRKMARFGVSYTYKGHPLPSFEFGPNLGLLKDLVSDLLGSPFNAAVINLYSTGEQGLAAHSDTSAIPELGKQPVIAGVSFGATRPFVLTPLSKKVEPTTVEVAHGDLLVMHGDSQARFRHSVPPVRGCLLPRWSVTFRFHHTDQ